MVKTTFFFFLKFISYILKCYWSHPRVNFCLHEEALHVYVCQLFRVPVQDGDICFAGFLWRQKHTCRHLKDTQNGRKRLKKHRADEV